MRLTSRLMRALSPGPDAGIRCDIILHTDIIFDLPMANISLRGLDSPTLLRIRSNARRRGVSVNRLIVETLQQQYAVSGTVSDDLDALAGAWTKAEADAFDETVAPFAEIETALWAAEPKAAYRAKRLVRRRLRK